MESLPQRLRTVVTGFFRQLLPLEMIALAFLGIALLISTIFSVRFYFPNGRSAVFALGHYALGFVAASALVLLFSWMKSQGSISSRPNLGIIVRTSIALATVVFLHCNCKLWAQLVNPRLFDDWYKGSDLMIAPIRDAILFINRGFAPLKAWRPGAYHDGFFLMFLVTFFVFGLHPVARQQLGKLASAIALVLAIGGLSYMIAPAWGPFVYSSSPQVIQKTMGAFQAAFIGSHGLSYNGGDFISALAAMPSLHAAHAFVLWYYACRYVRWLGYLYIPLLIFICTEAVASEWHYSIDLLCGLPITYGSILLAERLHRPVNGKIEG